MMSELVAATGDWGFGPTSERWVDGRWMATAICEATLQHAATTEVDFPPLLSFFESFLEISLRSAKSRYGNRFRSSLFIDIVQLLGFQNGSHVCL